LPPARHVRAGFGDHERNRPLPPNARGGRRRSGCWPPRRRDRRFVGRPPFGAVASSTDSGTVDPSGGAACTACWPPCPPRTPAVPELRPIDASLFAGTHFPARFPYSGARSISSPTGPALGAERSTCCTYPLEPSWAAPPSAPAMAPRWPSVAGAARSRPASSAGSPTTSAAMAGCLRPHLRVRMLASGRRGAADPSRPAIIRRVKPRGGVGQISGSRGDHRQQSGERRGSRSTRSPSTSTTDAAISRGRTRCSARSRTPRSSSERSSWSRRREPRRVAGGGAAQAGHPGRPRMPSPHTTPRSPRRSASMFTAPRQLRWRARSAHFAVRVDRARAVGTEVGALARLPSDSRRVQRTAVRAHSDEDC
jgi:hypothetical protein